MENNITRKAVGDALFVVYAGIDNVIRRRSEVLVCKCKEFIQNLKGNNRSVIFGKLPRYDTDMCTVNRVTVINNRVREIGSKKESTDFVDHWEE